MLQILQALLVRDQWAEVHCQCGIVLCELSELRELCTVLNLLLWPNKPVKLPAVQDFDARDLGGSAQEPGQPTVGRELSYRVETHELRSTVMLAKKHLRGVGTKEQSQYEHIKESAQRTGRYGKRAKEVAGRTVMKQHKQKGHGTSE